MPSARVHTGNVTNAMVMIATMERIIVD